jgi:hypothetical protein
MYLYEPSGAGGRPGLKPEWSCGFRNETLTGDQVKKT